jgi:hypothetical protein
MLFIALMVLAFFLNYIVGSQSAQVPPGPGPSVAADIGLLITVILCVSFSFWLTFIGKEGETWEKAVLVVGLVFASVGFWVLGVGETFGLMGVEMSYPAAFNNLSIAGDFLLATAAILGLAAVLAFILLLASLDVGKARARLQESR